ncbi:MAG: PEP-CTERM sorting domain-containing protein [Pirellulaceae bacterium]|nr:PEP-CTERM sorting domain-containing protein [Pirellulaceae bacterium]
MKIQQLTTLIMIAMLAALATASNAVAGPSFRGVVKDQGGNVIDENGGSNAMGSRPWFIDIEDNFNRSGGLNGSEADTWQVGFVPPSDTRNENGVSAHGELTGTLADEHGRWVGDGSFLVEGGQVSSSEASAVATTPWRVVSGLGDDYLLEADASIDAGGSATLAFAGGNSSNDLMDGEFGQLALQVSRDATDETQVSWHVKWDTDEAPGHKSEADVITVPAGEVRIQLAWNELMNTFDAWLGDNQLASGTLGAPGIDVHHLAFQLNNATLGSVVGAIPEPSSMVLMAVGLIGLLGYRNRK